MLRKAVLKIAPRLIYPCMVWWVWWSRLYRVIFHHKYKECTVPTLPLAIVGTKLARLKWTEDSLTELWDSCGSPHWVQYCLNVIEHGHEQPKGSLDCDDSSIWAAHALSDILAPRLISVVWRTNDGKIAGHVMCLCTDPNKGLFHIGNWGLIHDIEDIHELCLDLAVRTQATDILGWSILDKNLRIHQYGRGLPEKGNDGSLR